MIPSSLWETHCHVKPVKPHLSTGLAPTMLTADAGPIASAILLASLRKAGQDCYHIVVIGGVGDGFPCARPQRCVISPRS